jgi:hypothetical protein
MGWCLDCHRDPTPHLRPRDQITSMTWQGAPPVQAKHSEPDGRSAQDPTAMNDVHSRTSCSTCHR